MPVNPAPHIMYSRIVAEMSSFWLCISSNSIYAINILLLQQTPMKRLKIFIFFIKLNILFRDVSTGAIWFMLWFYKVDLHRCIVLWNLHFPTWFAGRWAQRSWKRSSSETGTSWLQKAKRWRLQETWDVSILTGALFLGDT